MADIKKEQESRLCVRKHLITHNETAKSVK